MGQIVTSDLLAGATTNFRHDFGKSFAAAMANQWWPRVVFRYPSDTDTETHTWLGTVAKMTDVSKEPLPVKGLNRYSFSLINRTYKTGLQVRRETLEDDKLGQIQPRIANLGLEAARHPGELISNLLTGGTSTSTTAPVYDGLAFFADTRTIGSSANIDNLLAGSGATPDALLTDLSTADSTMMRFQDEEGRPQQKMIDTIICPVAIYGAWYQALTGGSTADDGTNILRSMPPPATVSFTVAGRTVIADPYLDATDTNDWYGLNTTSGEMPFVFQERVAPTVEDLQMGSDLAVLQDSFLWTVRGRYAEGYGEPRSAVKVVVT